MTSTVAVTGGTGLVGKAVIERLLDDGHDIVSLVRTVGGGGTSPAQHKGQSPVLQLNAGDLNSPDYGSIIPTGISAVVHCAARVHVMRDRSADPLTAFRRANVNATLSLARHAARQGVKRFVYISSIKVNGERTRRGTSFRSDDIANQHDAYGVSKMETETALRAAGASTGLEVTIIRPPLVYGPGVKGNLALLARLIRSGLPIPLGGIRGNRRSLIAVGNLADLIVRCVSHPDAANETFLASDDDDLSTTQLLHLMAMAMGRRSHLVPVPPAAIRLLATIAGRPEVAERLCGSLQIDIARTRERLEWTPPLSVKTGLALAFAPVRQQDR